MYLGNIIFYTGNFSIDILLRCWLVMGRAWIFRALGGLGLLCIGPRAGRAFLYRASGFFRAFPKYKMHLFFCFMSMKYEVFLVKFFQLSTRPQIRPEMGWKSANFWLISRQKKLENFFVTKSPIILPKFSRKLAKNRPIFGPKKPAGLSGFEDRASGGLGAPKKRLGRAGFGISPRPDPSLISGTQKSDFG